MTTLQQLQYLRQGRRLRDLATLIDPEQRLAATTVCEWLSGRRAPARMYTRMIQEAYDLQIIKTGGQKQ